MNLVAETPGKFWNTSSEKNVDWIKIKIVLIKIIIHQTHYEKSDWSRAFNQFTIACELDMINAISAADIAFYHVEFNICLVTKPLGVFAKRFASVSEDELCEKCINIIKQLLHSVFA